VRATNRGIRIVSTYTARSSARRKPTSALLREHCPLAADTAGSPVRERCTVRSSRLGVVRWQGSGSSQPGVTPIDCRQLAALSPSSAKPPTCPPHGSARSSGSVSASRARVDRRGARNGGTPDCPTLGAGFRRRCRSYLPTRCKGSRRRWRFCSPKAPRAQRRRGEHEIRRPRRAGFLPAGEELQLAQSPSALSRRSSAPSRAPRRPSGRDAGWPTDYLLLGGIRVFVIILCCNGCGGRVSADNIDALGVE
jgi:hypothetical protein